MSGTLAYPLTFLALLCTEHIGSVAKVIVINHEWTHEQFKVVAALIAQVALLCLEKLT